MNSKNESCQPETDLLVGFDDVEQESLLTAPVERIASVDALRGLVILLMIFVNDVAGRWITCTEEEVHSPSYDDPHIMIYLTDTYIVFNGDGIVEHHKLFDEYIKFIDVEQIDAIGDLSLAETTKEPRIINCPE